MHTSSCLSLVRFLIRCRMGLIIFITIIFTGFTVHMYDNYLDSQLVDGYRDFLFQETNVLSMDRKFCTDANCEARQPAPHTTVYVEAKRPMSPTIKILLWRPDNVIKDYLWKKSISVCSLPQGKKCEITYNASFYNESEAVVFHLRNLKNLSMYPTYRMSFQKWILMEEKSPPESRHRHWPLDDVMQVIKGWFNLTSTYHNSSHVQLTDYIPDIKLDEDLWEKMKDEDNDYSADKKRNVAWIPTQCMTQSGAEDYVKELSKYIDVDVYGPCGNLSCSRFCDMSTVDRSYRFYLAFENSLCDGYVTDTLWTFLKETIKAIPIVMGRAEYRKLFLDGTVIDIRNYKSPMDLAAYLKRIASSPHLFNYHITKRLSLKRYMKKEFQHPYHCRLCEYLHAHRDQVITVEDILQVWSQESLCIPPWKYYHGDFWKKVPFSRPLIRKTKHQLSY